MIGRATRPIRLAVEPRPPETRGETVTCAGCFAVHDEADLAVRWRVCPTCAHHHRLTARDRIRLLADLDTFEEWDAAVRSADPLRFVDVLPYAARVADAERATGEREAVVTGCATLRGRPIGLGAFEFGFMGGSMGCAVGEKLARLFARAAADGLPVVVATASGGARMQEGILSLMQMAKVTVGIERLRRARLPYVALLTDPTTGGVAASLATLGDLVIGEPGAQIGFAGPRVIEQTIRTRLPHGFQRAERLLEHGMLDAVVPRSELRDWLAAALDAFAPEPV